MTIRPASRVSAPSASPKASIPTRVRGGQPDTRFGHEHTFVHAMKDLLAGIGDRTINPGPSFEEGFAVQAVLDAVERSAAEHAWTKPEQP